MTVFLALVAFPIWYALGITKDASATDFPSDLELPDKSYSQCVKDKDSRIEGRTSGLRTMNGSCPR